MWYFSPNVFLNLTHCCFVSLSYSSNKLVCLKDYVGGISEDKNLVFVVFSKLLKFVFIMVGAMRHGKIDADYVDDLISGYAFSIMFVIIKRFMLDHACSSFPTFFSGFQLINDIQHKDTL
ncbi:hypothetical protein QQP08_021082 [Theobroma cacao]|nr:hypothetical protein QQP08_021082 [Theobroma cacao]